MYSGKSIQCKFDPVNDVSVTIPLCDLEVYYGFTKELIIYNPDFSKYLTNQEKGKADRLKIAEDRDTYIFTHGLLRLILSRKLGVQPYDVCLKVAENNKPEIVGCPLYFNITHIRNAFAFVISENYYVGIDMEDASQWIDFRAMADNCFSQKERNFIFEPGADSLYRFFLLWTRKEALLKAFGTGIVADLKKIELVNEISIINKDIFNGLLSYPLFEKHFIYSEEVSNLLLSIATPARARVKLKKISAAELKTYL